MEIELLWEKYTASNDKEIKKKIIEHYIELVKIIAGRMYNFYGTKIEYDDLLGYGVLGLIDSIDKFDLSKKIKFETYAQIRIKGAIIDSIRKLDWIPRSLRKKAKDVQTTIASLENRYGRSPTDSEIAMEMGVSEEELTILLSDISTFNMSSLEEIVCNSGDYFSQSGKSVETPNSAYESKEMKELLSQAINLLNKNEKLVISLYYYEDLTYKEIGDIMELSESRISQIHSKAIMKMKNTLARQGITSNY